MRRSASLAIGVVLAGLLLMRGAPAGAQTVAVIEPGREEEILALFAPHALGEEVRDGVRLANVSIERTTVRAELEGAGGARGEVRLAHPDAAPDAERRSESFAIAIDASDPGVREAAEALAGAVERNDGGGFWRTTARERPPDGTRARLGGAVDWVTDGTVLSLLALVVLVVLVARQVRRDGRAVGALLAGAVVVGLAYRLWLSPHTVLGAWPYSRTVELMRRIWEGPALATLSAEALGPLAYMDVATTVTLVFATVTPLALFAHARTLTGDARVAVVAAAVVAVLPAHVRFSHSEVAFIPSIALSSLTFALVHVATKDPSVRWRWLATAMVPVLVTATLVTRPLNVMFVPLFVIAALAFRAERVPRWRAGLVVTLVVAAGAATTWVHFLHYYGDQVREATDPRLAWDALRTLFSLRLNTLVHPGITPPVLAVMAVLGAVWRWRSDRRLVVFLLGWLALFFVAHAYVVPHQSAMQARYHLHLVAPFALLCGLGLVELARRRRRVAMAAGALVALSPLVHLDFVRDVAFNDLREYAFVSEAAERIPDGCAVLEHTGPGTGDHDARFARLGAVLDGHVEERRWPVYPIGAAPGSADPIRGSARRALGGSCVYYYEGIPCWSERRDGEPIAAACAAMRDAAPLEPVLRRRHDSRVYDGNLALGEGVDELALTLYRIRARR